jgi:hypothetical protein
VVTGMMTIMRAKRNMRAEASMRAGMTDQCPKRGIRRALRGSREI